MTERMKVIQDGACFLILRDGPDGETTGVRKVMNFPGFVHDGDIRGAKIARAWFESVNPGAAIDWQTPGPA